MGYTGDYYCQLPACGFKTPVIADKYVMNEAGKRELVPGTATAARMTMLDHGEEVHAQSWATVGNEQWIRPVVA